MPQVFLEWEKKSSTVLEKVFFLFLTVSSFSIPQVFLEWEKISNTVLDHLEQFTASS
jgi:hypothetical protein